MINHELTPILALFSGHLPGSGASTAANGVLENLKSGHPELKVEKLPSGGHLRRALALHWYEFCTERGIPVQPDLEVEEGSPLDQKKQICWNEFTPRYLQHRQNPTRAIDIELSPYLQRKSEYKEGILKAFSKDSERYGGGEAFWIHLPEIHLLRLLSKLEADVVVWESKNATYIDLLVGELIKLYPSLVQAIHIDHFFLERFVLEVGALTSAHRVAQREIEDGNLDMKVMASDKGMPVLEQDELLRWWQVQGTGITNIKDGLPERLTKPGRTGTLFSEFLNSWRTSVINTYLEMNTSRMNEDAQRYANAYNLPPSVFTAPFRVQHPTPQQVTRINAERPENQVQADIMKAMSRIRPK
jgi:hypothetical protein